MTSTTNIPPVPLIEKALPVAASTGRTASFVAAPRMAYLPKGSTVAMGFTDVIFLLSFFGAVSVSSAPLPTTLAVKKEAGLESQGADEVGGAGAVEWPAGLASLTCEKPCTVFYTVFGKNCHLQVFYGSKAQNGACPLSMLFFSESGMKCNSIRQKSNLLLSPSFF